MLFRIQNINILKKRTEEDPGMLSSNNSNKISVLDANEQLLSAGSNDAIGGKLQENKEFN